MESIKLCFELDLHYLYYSVFYLKVTMKFKWEIFGPLFRDSTSVTFKLQILHNFLKHMQNQFGPLPSRPNSLHLIYIIENKHGKTDIFHQSDIYRLKLFLQNISFKTVWRQVSREIAFFVLLKLQGCQNDGSLFEDSCFILLPQNAELCYSVNYINYKFLAL